MAYPTADGSGAGFDRDQQDSPAKFYAFMRRRARMAIKSLVMGAYRHSRLNEIVWGGATKTVIGRPLCWVMMSR
jgi:hypothetical protein